MKSYCITLLLFVFSATGLAQFPRVEIPGSEVRKITSSIVSGQEYELHILLPAGFNNAKKYPVVYLMDSQWDFPLAKSIYGQQYFDGFIPELIIVGVTWGGVNPNPDSLRARDYTPTNEKRSVQSGGADKFLSFMKEELFPFVEKNYSTDPNKRTLMGCSLGGLVTLYALFTHNDMFNGYVAASPAIGWDNEVIYKYEKQYFEGRSTKPVRLFMTIGGVERNVPGFERLTKFLEDRNYQSLNIKSKVLDNTGHSGTKSETYNRGMQYIFERPRLNVGSAILAKYTGSYQSPGGNILELKNVNDQLVVYFSATNKYQLYAATESYFYSTAEFFNLHFTETDQKIDGVSLERYGGSQFLKKIR